METLYGLQFRLVKCDEINRFFDYDKTVAYCHIERFGSIITDEMGTVIDNEYDLDEIQKVLMYNKI